MMIIDKTTLAEMRCIIQKFKRTKNKELMEKMLYTLALRC